MPSTLTRWPEVDPQQPDGALPDVLGLPGRRQLDVLNELGLARGCLAFPAVEASLMRGPACLTGRLRRLELAESAMPAALADGTIDLALMTLAGFDAAGAALRPLRIDGVKPARASVRDGSYPLAQPLYLYVKSARVGVQPGLAGFLAALTAEPALGPSGDLAALGLVPLPRAERAAARQAARTLPPLVLERRTLLSVPPIAQYNEVWSWAAAAEMVLRFAGLPPLSPLDTYRCTVVAARFGSCQPDCAGCLNPVASAASLVRALAAYQAEIQAQGRLGAPLIAPAATRRLTAGALARRIGEQRLPVLAQVAPQGVFYPTGMTSHFAVIVGIAGRKRQAVLTVNDPYPYPEAENPYLATGVRTAEPGQYRISYGDFRERLGWWQSVVLR